jgi:uridine kinase
MTFSERAQVNFDHPDSLDTDLLIEHIKALKAGKAVRIPKYDFTTHSRTTQTTLIKPNRIIIVDGILLFAHPELLELLDMKVCF